MAVAKGTTESELKEAERGLQQWAPVLDDLSHVWKEPDHSRLWWDDYYKVFTTSNSRHTYSGLFGKWAPLRGWKTIRFGLGKLRRLCSVDRWSGPFQLDVPVSSDAVIIPLRVNEGIIVASFHEDKVLKVVSGRKSGLLQNDRQAWKYAIQAGVESHIPRVFNFGQQEMHSHWILTEFAPNTHPLHQPFVTQAIISSKSRHERWRRWLEVKILPFLVDIYKESRCKTLNSQMYIRHLQELVEVHPFSHKLKPLLQHVERAASVGECGAVVIANLHGDLKPEHVHRSYNTWKIIDWGNGFNGSVLFDLIHYFLFRSPFRDINSQAGRSDWSWVSGKAPLIRTTKNLQSYVRLYARWLKEWKGIQLSVEAVRFHMLGMLLEHFCARGKLPGNDFSLSDSLAVKWLSTIEQ